MNNSRTLFLLTAILIGSSALQAQSSAEDNASNHAIPVAGTTLAAVHNAVEVLNLLPGVTFNDENQVVVEGKLGTAIYIGTHKVTDISELYTLEAEKIKSVEVLTAPGADYGKDVQSVIIFHLKTLADNGVSFSNDLTASINTRFSINDELHVGYKRDKLNLGAYLSWAENKQKVHSRNFSYMYTETDQTLASANISEVDAYTTEHRKIVAQADLGYDFSDKHRINVFFRTDNTPRKTGYNNSQAYVYLSESGRVDLNNPSTISEPGYSEPSLKESRNQINAEYHGKWGKWSIDLGHNSQWFDSKNQVSLPKEGMQQEYNRKSFTMRNYLKTSVPLWLGSLSIGIEQNMQSMDVLQYDADMESLKVHTLNGINTWADYISLSQKWGKFSASAGLRHEHNRLSYNPDNDDDAFIKYLVQLKYEPDNFEEFRKDYKDWENSIPARLLKDGIIITRKHHFYPNASITFEASEKSVLSLSFSRTYHIADLELSRIKLEESYTKEEKKLLKTEHIYNTVLSWNYDWLNLSASHSFYDDPLCMTTAGHVVFNGKDYHFMDLTAILSPKIGCWQPSLMLKFNKQWFNMKLANGRPNMNRPRLIIHFNNTVTLPKDWTLYTNAEWYSKGDLRNVYYYSGDFMMNLGIQKMLLNKHLSLALKAENALHSSWTDTSTFRKAKYHVSNGSKSRKLTTILISAKYTLK